MSDIPGGMSKVLQQVCRKYKIPLAQIWTPEKKKGTSIDLRCSLEHWSKYLGGSNQIDQRLVQFSKFCHSSCLAQGLGVVGKAFLHRKPYFCKDVSQLPISEYPFSDYARRCGLTGSLAICLDSNSGVKTRSRTPDYILELFLPNIPGELQKMLGSLLTTLKQDLQGFSVYSGLGEESCVEVVTISMNAKEPDTLKIRLGPGLQSNSESFPHTNDERTSMHSLPTAEALEEDIRSIDISGDRAGKVASGKGKMNAGEFTSPSFSTPPKASSREVVSKSKENTTSMYSSTAECRWSRNASQSPQERSSNMTKSPLPKGKREVISSISDTEHAKEVQHPKKMKFDGTRNVTDRSLMEVASNSKEYTTSINSSFGEWPLNSSRSPQERSSNMTKSPPPKGKREVNPSTSDTEHAKEIKHPKKMKSDGTRNVIIKAKYGDDIIRFDIPFSSKMTELIEKVTLRLPLNGRPFKIKLQDEEDDNDWILIACDEDLQHFFDTFRSSDKNRNKISMKIESID